LPFASLECGGLTPLCLSLFWFWKYGPHCNAKKTDRQAEEFLRWLFREGKLNSLEMKSRFRALRALKAGKLKPQIG
jgi:hypothetical protein